jgi:hypothetical protein
VKRGFSVIRSDIWIIPSRNKKGLQVIEIPSWLQRKVKGIFGIKPSTWQIFVKRFKTALEVIKHNADVCLTYPELAIVPPAGGRRVSFDQPARISACESISASSLPSLNKAMSLANYDSLETQMGSESDANQTDYTKGDPYEEEVYKRSSPWSGTGIPLSQLFENLIDTRNLETEDSQQPGVIETGQKKISRGLIFQKQLANLNVYVLLLISP